MNLYVEKEVVEVDNSFSLPDYVYENCIVENGCALTCVVDATVLQLEKMGISLPSGGPVATSCAPDLTPPIVLASADNQQSVLPIPWALAESAMQWLKPGKLQPVVITSALPLKFWTHRFARCQPALYTRHVSTVVTTDGITPSTSVPFTSDIRPAAVYYARQPSTTPSIQFLQVSKILPCYLMNLLVNFPLVGPTTIFCAYKLQ